MARYANQAHKGQRIGLASRAAARSAAAHQQCEAELHEVQGVCTSPCCKQRECCCGGTSGAEDVQVEPSQLIEQSQSLHLFDGVDDKEEDDGIGSVKRSTRGGRNECTSNGIDATINIKERGTRSTNWRWCRWQWSDLNDSADTTNSYPIMSTNY